MITPDLPSLSYLALVYDDGRNTPWTPTRCDLLEEDWVINTALSTAPAAQPEDEVKEWPFLTTKGFDQELRQMAEGCCSASSPCGHQKRDPYSICKVCQEANTLAAAPAADGGRA
jgi:hypothetical protein